MPGPIALPTFLAVELFHQQNNLLLVQSVSLPVLLLAQLLRQHFLTYLVFLHLFTKSVALIISGVNIGNKPCPNFADVSFIDSVKHDWRLPLQCSFWRSHLANFSSWTLHSYNANELVLLD